MLTALTNRLVPAAAAAVCPLLLAMPGCVAPGQTATTVTHSGPSMMQARVEPYNGPKARIAVGDFAVKASGATRQIGDGLREMLLTSLFSSNRFIVLERQALEGIILEQDLGRSGRINAATAAPTGAIEGAELLVYGVVSEFKQGASGAGLDFAIPNVPLTFGGNVRNAHVAIDLRIVETATGRILYAGRVEGKAADYDARLGATIGGGSSRIPFALSAYEGTPMEKAVRACIDAAVAHVATRTPPRYFRHGFAAPPVYAGPPMPPAGYAQPAYAAPGHANPGDATPDHAASSTHPAFGGPGAARPIGGYGAAHPVGGGDPFAVPDEVPWSP